MKNCTHCIGGKAGIELKLGAWQMVSMPLKLNCIEQSCSINPSIF